MSAQGVFHGSKAFPTSEYNIIEAIKAIKAKQKYLAVEEGNLAHWVSQVAKPYVTEVICADPKKNAWIYRGATKSDRVDTEKLCRLLRLGELKRVYHAETDDRAIFKAAVQHYNDLRDQQTALKQKIKAMYRHWGVIDVEGEAVYSTTGLKRVKQLAISNQLQRLYYLMDETASMQARALKTVKQMGRKYPEIKEFTHIPGVGDVVAHTFDAYIQTPHRFATKRQLWRYCRLGVSDRSSDGKPLGYKRLDPSGVGELKALSYRAWLSATKGDNEVNQYYHRSLRRTHCRVHARLNTQRKILAVMYGIWKTGQAYSKEQFLEPSQRGVA
jgi:transposase